MGRHGTRMLPIFRYRSQVGAGRWPVFAAPDRKGGRQAVYSVRISVLSSAGWPALGNAFVRGLWLVMNASPALHLHLTARTSPLRLWTQILEALMKFMFSPARPSKST